MRIETSRNARHGVGWDVYVHVEIRRDLKLR